MAEEQSGFDWVTARGKCSGPLILRQLSVQAKRNVEAINAMNVGNGRPPFEYVEPPGEGWFSVVERIEGGGRVIVTFRHSGDDIVVTHDPGQELLTGTLCLNDAGECRIRVNNETLSQWRFLERVLEPLFFPPKITRD